MPTLQLDPRANMVIALIWTVAMTMVESIAALILGLIPIIIIVYWCRQQQAFVRWLRMIAVIIAGWVMIAILSLDWQIALQIGLRILVLAGIFFVFLRTTSPEDLGGALQQIGVPFSITFLLTASLQYVGVMEHRIRQIIDAQRARGIPLEPGWHALRFYPALLIPLLAQSFIAAEHLAAAMEAREFSRLGRTQLVVYHWRYLDTIAVGVTLLAALLIWSQC